MNSVCLITTMKDNKILKMSFLKFESDNDQFCSGKPNPFILGRYLLIKITYEARFTFGAFSASLQIESLRSRQWRAGRGGRSFWLTPLQTFFVGRHNCIKGAKRSPN